MAVRSPPSGPEWLHELEYDGARIACFVELGEVRLVDRRGRDRTAEFPEVVGAAKRLAVDEALLDGVVTVVLADGTTSAAALEAAITGGARSGLTYFVFDLLRHDGASLAELPLEQRKVRCEALVHPLHGTSLRYSAHFDADGPTVFARACELGAGGIVSKRRDWPYQSGLNDAWRRTRCVKRPARETSPARTANPPVVAGITLTTPERSVYPALGLTKLELARYYESVAERMLPYIADRPLTLVRCEKGVRAADALRSDCKFLRHEPGWHRWAKEPISRVMIREQKKIGEYLVVNSPAGLVSLVQGDILEVHVWNSTVARLEAPDRLVFDLDPGSAVAWRDVIDAARLLREQLLEAGLKSWVKTTGGKGLHVVVPFRAEHDWDHVYAFARATAEAFARREPTAFTLEYGKRGREQKILLDYKRNHRAAVAVAAYSARARASASVSLPLDWDELASSVGPDAWTLLNVNERLTRPDPWEAFWSSRQRLPCK